MPKNSRCFFIMWALLPLSAQAEEPPTTPANLATFEAVNVNGLGDPAWQPYKRLLLGVEAFHKHKNLAPQAPLYFSLRPQKSGLTFEGVKLTLEAADKAQSIPLDSLGRFILPAPSTDIPEEAELVLNRSKSLYKWRPYIRTPGRPENSRRLGDLRLECEVRWAVEYEDMGFLLRNTFRALGGPCNSKNARVLNPAPVQISAVKLIDGQRQETLADKSVINDGRIYYVPLHDKSWSDETTVELIPSDSPSNVSSAEVITK